MNIDKKISEKIPLYCLLKLQAVYDNLKSAEKKAADFLLENPDYLTDATITDAAKRAGCSEPTFVRLSRKMGLEGFAELKSELTRMKYMKNSPDRELSEFSIDDNPIEITKKVFTSSIQALNDTLMIIDEVQYKRAIDILQHAKKVAFFRRGRRAFSRDVRHVQIYSHRHFLYRNQRCGTAC